MIKEEVRQLKKCCKKIAYSTSLCFETNTLWYISYPEPGSNRHGLPHWCLRPARLPIPPSGHAVALYWFYQSGCKDTIKF